MYDIIIVGYGTTSSCIVYKLKYSQLKILVINQGSLIEDDNVKYLKNFNTVWKNSKYTTIVGISETDNNVTQGRIMGGSSMHNGCVAIKPSNFYLDYLNLNDEEIPIDINSTNNNNLASKEIVKVISELFNVPIVQNHNEYNFSISKDCQMFINKQQERSMVTQLLEDLPYNIEFLEAFCINVILQNKKAVGVRCLVDNMEMEFFSDKVIISAGINSSLILERSGIGKNLEEFNITTVLENKNVGRNLKNQIGPSFCIRFPERFLNNLEDNQLGMLGMGFLPNEEGTRQFQVMITKFPFIKQELIDLQNTISINICNLDPVSSGNINIISKDITCQPNINFNSLSENEDKINFLISIEHGYNIYLKLKEKIPEIELIFPTEEMILNFSLEKLSSVTSLVTEHYTGTCRIGESIEDSVVDKNLKVHGIENLYVCDASVFPFCPDGNPQYACMLLGLNF